MNIAIYSGSHSNCTRLRVYGFPIVRLAHQLLHMTSQARARGQTNQAGRDPRGPLLLAWPEPERRHRNLGLKASFLDTLFFSVCMKGSSRVRASGL